MPEIRAEFERDNEYVKLYEENRRLKLELSTVQAAAREYEREIKGLRGMLERCQEAIVNQALLFACAVEWDNETEQD